MNKKTINILKDFGDTPYGRFPHEWKYCGETFREKLLYPALKEYDNVEVVLDGIRTYGPSFLEEAFGGLVRVKGMTQENLQKKLLIIANNSPSRIKQIWFYIEDASNSLNHDMSNE